MEDKGKKKGERTLSECEKEGGRSGRKKEGSTFCSLLLSTCGSPTHTHTHTHRLCLCDILTKLTEASDHRDRHKKQKKAVALLSFSSF